MSLGGGDGGDGDGGGKNGEGFHDGPYRHLYHYCSTGSRHWFMRLKD
jgi:hypothetical protein